MKIYTKTGDKGETSLFGGKRVWKDDLRITAYGNVDELNSVLGLVVAETTDEQLKSELLDIQSRLFDLGADLASPVDDSKNTSHISRIDSSYPAFIEELIDKYDGKLEPLKNFILPGGSKASAFLHNARTVCRRAERSVVKLDRVEEIGTDILIFLNRLSDLFFVFARYFNKINAIDDIEWKSKT